MKLVRMRRKLIRFSVIAVMIGNSLFISAHYPAVPEAAGVTPGRWLKGFARSVSGETIGYHSGHPLAASALLVRALDGRMSIEWETEAVPAEFSGKEVAFIWLAGKAASMGSHSFELSVDGQPLFTIKTGSEGTAADEVQDFEAPNGSRLEFRRTMTDQFGDTFGPMILRVPASAVTPGRPVRVRVRGENAGSRDWFMTFQYGLEPAVGIRPEPALVRESGGTRRLVRVEVDHCAEPADISIRASDGTTARGRLEPGHNSFMLQVQPVRAETSLEVEISVNGQAIHKETLALRPVRPRLLYLLPHSHTDIGYSGLQVKVEKDHWRYLMEAVELARRTENYPEGARFKWNVEVLWPLETFLRQAPAEERREVIEAARQGRLEFQAALANVLTGVCPPEELLHLTDFARRLRREFGLPLDSAMITDIPGSLWTVVPALAQGGVKYYSSGPNYMPFLPDGGDRIGHFSKAWADKPFYWVSPSGREKILFWTAGRGYSWFHGLNMGELATAGERPILEYVRELEDKGYPYDIVQVRYTIGGDNGPPDPRLPDLVRDWNARFESPKLVIATAGEMFRELERRHGSVIPSFAGDLSPYWEDGSMSTAAESVLNRNAVHRLLQAETVWALRDPASFPAEEFDEAWRQALLWDEHTWGAHNSVSEPDQPEVRAQWEYKSAFALEADRRSRELLERALRAPPSTKPDPPCPVDILNTTSWERTDIVFLPAALSKAGDRVTDIAGREIPSQRLSDGSLAVLAENAPGLGAKRLLVGPGKAWKGTGTGFRISTEGLENEKLKLILDKESGAVSSLVWKEQGLELVDSDQGLCLNDYLYVPGRDPGDALRTSKSVITVKENGPLLASLHIASEAPGCRSLSREVRLYHGLDRVDIVDTLDKIEVREKESGHIAFPFRVPGGVMRMDTGWGFVRPEEDQLAGSCRDFLCVHSGVDISNEEFGLTWASPDAPLVEPGALTDERQNDKGTRSWREKTAPGTVLFSYIFNNYWHTNYKAGQEGPVVFRYALRPHGPFDPAAAGKFSAKTSQPLLAVAADPTSSPPQPLFRLEPSSVVVSSLKPSRDGKALMVRLFNASDKPQHVRFTRLGLNPAQINWSNLEEGSGPEVNEAFDLAPWAVVTLKTDTQHKK